jgi:hypothetical protein
MIPKQVVQLGNRGMAIGKNLGIELAQGLVHLCRVQLHGLLLFCLQLVWGCSLSASLARLHVPIAICWE